jgi:hypothetical protein
MPAPETIELPFARVEIEERAGYLYIVETGTLKTVAEVGVYAAKMEAVMARTGKVRAIIDARDETSDNAPAEVRNAMWEWLVGSGRAFQMVAFILPSEMAVARVNMTALSRRAQVRAFENVQEAQRWLTRGPRSSSLSMAPVSEAPRTSRPPTPADGATRPGPTPPKGHGRGGGGLA